MRSLYERVGGAPAVAAVVDELYERLTTDAQVRHHFDPDRLESLKDGQRQWFRSVLGDPDTPERPDLVEAHRDVTITDDDVAVVLAHLRDCLLGAGVAADLTNTVVALVGRLWYARLL